MVLWIIGLTNFLGEKNFLNWAIWGFLAVPFVFGWILKLAKKGANDSARDGARHYTYDVSAGTIKNHTFSGYVFGFIVSLVLGFLAGPIAFVLVFGNGVLGIIDLVKLIKESA